MFFKNRDIKNAAHNDDPLSSKRARIGTGSSGFQALMPLEIFVDIDYVYMEFIMSIKYWFVNHAIEIK